jgi:serine/threonine-protein kinase
MAPEQVAGKRGDERSDIYATGVLLYEMLANALPFAAPNGYAALHAKLDEDPTPLSSHFPRVDPAVDAIVSRAIARDARERHGSAREMLKRLRRRDVSDMGVGEPAAERRRAWIARAAVLLAFTGLSVLIWLSRPLERPPIDSSSNVESSIPAHHLDL